jgi:hypothetical protein
MRALLAALMLSPLLSPASAASGIAVGKLGVGGTGCPAGTAKASLSGDGKTLSIRFDSYRATAGGAKSFDRKFCGLSIPISVPAGMSVALVSVDFAGVNHLPAGASNTFRAEYFLTGTKGPVFEKTFKGPTDARFSTAAKGALSYSGCGADTILRTNSSLLVRTTGGRTASASIRAADVRTAMVFHLSWKRC